MSSSKTIEDNEEYIKLRYGKDPIEVFNLFVKRNVPQDLHAHFADSDDNEAEFVRRAINTYIREVCEEVIGEDEEPIEPCRDCGYKGEKSDAQLFWESNLRIEQRKRLEEKLS